MTFALPPELSAEAARELARARILGAPDAVPSPTHVRLEPCRVTVSRDVDESGFLAVPWHIPGVGLLLTASATLMERAQPYHLQVELARGKVNQVRGVAADWQMGGLHLPQAFVQALKDATLAFGRAVTRSPALEAEDEARRALVLAYHAADKLVQAYVGQVLHARHQRQPLLDTVLGCRLAAVPMGAAAEALASTCNGVVVPLPWREVEAGEGAYRWEAAEAVLAWAAQQGLRVAAGPLVDFALARLPTWLWLWEKNRADFASFVCDYVEVVVKRYQHRVRTWQLCTRANVAAGFPMSEEELLWLTVKMAETVRRIDPALEVVVSVTQPWGEYLLEPERPHSPPFMFADTLLRNGVQLAALDVELVMGVTPRGSYCRDLLEVSRLLDLYAILGVPLQVTLAYPAQAGADPRAEADLCVDAGYWRAGVSAEGQADWAEAVASLALAKPYVRAVYWAHFSDAEPHQLPHCGLVDAAGQVRPALGRLRTLRQQHLR
jgi:hypothetical protein